MEAKTENCRICKKLQHQIRLDEAYGDKMLPQEEGVMGEGQVNKQHKNVHGGSAGWYADALENPLRRGRDKPKRGRRI